MNGAFAGLIGGVNTAQPSSAPIRQDEKNRKLLEDLNRTRQMMLKNSGNRTLFDNSGTSGGSGLLSKELCRAPAVINGLDMQTSVTYLTTNSSYGNSILPVIPRIPPD